MHNNYVANVYRRNGLISSSINNVTINTAYVSLPYMIEDAILRGEGRGEWDRWGDELMGVYENHLVDRIRSHFKSGVWFNKLSDEGEAEILSIKVRMLAD